MIDWAIDGMMQVQGAGVFKRTHAAKTEFHYQLFKSEHKRFYGAQDLQILDECKDVANIGWLHRLAPKSLIIYYRPPPIDRGNLAEINISKAYTGAFLRIRVVSVFNEFDIWQAYRRDDPIKNLSLDLVEANSFDLFLNTDTTSATATSGSSSRRGPPSRR